MVFWLVLQKQRIQSWRQRIFGFSPLPVQISFFLKRFIRHVPKLAPTIIFVGAFIKGFAMNNPRFVSHQDFDLEIPISGRFPYHRSSRKSLSRVEKTLNLLFSIDQSPKNYIKLSANRSIPSYRLWFLYVSLLHLFILLKKKNRLPFFFPDNTFPPSGPYPGPLWFGLKLELFWSRVSIIKKCHRLSTVGTERSFCLIRKIGDHWIKLELLAGAIH